MSIHNRNAHVPLSPADLVALTAQVAALQTVLAALPEVETKLLRRVVKIGAKSETFCRRTLVLASQNQGLLPRDLNVEEVQATQALRDQLVVRLLDVERLALRLKHTVALLGSDVYSASLAAYNSMRANNRDVAIVEQLDELATNFSRKKAKKVQEPREDVGGAGNDLLTQAASNAAMKPRRVEPDREEVAAGDEPVQTRATPRKTDAPSALINQRRVTSRLQKRGGIWRLTEERHWDGEPQSPQRKKARPLNGRR